MVSDRADTVSWYRYSSAVVLRGKNRVEEVREKKVTVISVGIHGLVRMGGDCGRNYVGVSDLPKGIVMLRRGR